MWRREWWTGGGGWGARSGALGALLAAAVVSFRAAWSARVSCDCVESFFFSFTSGFICFVFVYSVPLFIVACLK